MVIQHKLYTYQEFEEILADPANQDRLLELINGEIVEHMPTEDHGEVVLRLGARLIMFVDDHHLGHVTTEAMHRMPDDIYNGLRLDISFISGERDTVKKGAVLRMPDLAVEVKSPDNTYKSLRQKAEYYLQQGSKAVWLIFPEKQILEIYTPNADVEILTIDDELQGGDVLPGFKVAVRQIFMIPR